MEVWVAILLIISTALTFIICGAVYWYKETQRRRHALIQYNTADNYSTLESEVKFKNSKTTKMWIGHIGLGNIINMQKKELLREQYEAYAAAMKIAKNWCKLSNLRNTENERKMADELPCIGHRQFSKFYHPMFDDKYGSKHVASKKMANKRVLLCHYDCNQLPALNSSFLDDPECEQIALGKNRVIDFSDDEEYRAFRLILETLKHPYIMETHEVNLSKDKRHIFIVRDLEKKGSLRDHIHCSDLSQSYDEKYCIPGKSLSIERIRKYGRQILEAMQYLHECGLLCYHLHSGNIIIQNDNAKISEIENIFMGYQLRHPLHQHLCAVKKIYGDLNIEACLFGYILFEMLTGYESPTASPLDCLHEIPVKLDRSIIHLLGRIFGDKSLCCNITISDLIDDPLFNAINVPKGDVSMFVSLRKENETAQKMMNALMKQCYCTYSMQVLLGDKRQRTKEHITPIAKRKKKKKKKKKKSKENVAIVDPKEEQQTMRKNTRSKSQTCGLFDEKQDDEENNSAQTNALWSNM